MSNGDKSSITPWKNGFYQSTVMPTTIFFIENETFCFFPASGKPTNLKDNPSLNGTIKFGDFGEIHPDAAFTHLLPKDCCIHCAQYSSINYSSLKIKLKTYLELN